MGLIEAVRAGVPGIGSPRGRSPQPVLLGAAIATLVAGALSGANAGTGDVTALKAAADLCADGPISHDSVRDVLGPAGWNEANSEIVLLAPASSEFAFGLDATDAGYSYTNAGFMAVSILGNSSLGPNQLGFIHNEARLAMIGVEEGTPYCVMPGPDWVFEAFVPIGDDPIAWMKTELGAVGMGLHDGAVYVAARHNKPKLADLAVDTKAGTISETGTSVAEYRSFLDEVFRVSNIKLVPATLPEES